MQIMTIKYALQFFFFELTDNVIMITVLIMNVIFWVVNFKTQNYFVISTTQNVYLRLSMYNYSNFVYSCRIFGISELHTVLNWLSKWQESKVGLRFLKVYLHFTWMSRKWRPKFFGRHSMTLINTKWFSLNDPLDPSWHIQQDISINGNTDNDWTTHSLILNILKI
jgi:hypothetical protein